MSEQTYPANLVGTWECFEAYTKSGEHHPHPEGLARVVYQLDVDGSGTLMPGTIAEVAMHWSVADGRLRVGSRKPKHQDTQAYEITDQGTLVLFDRYGGRSVFRRLTSKGAAIAAGIAASRAGDRRVVEIINRSGYRITEPSEAASYFEELRELYLREAAT